MPVYLNAAPHAIQRNTILPAGLTLIARAQTILTPPLVTDLHRSLQQWFQLRLSPGPMIPERVFVGAGGELAFAFDEGTQPRALMSNVGPSYDLAGWLVLLDKWMETFVVVARARTVWSTLELAGALPFVTPAFLPPALVRQPPDNCARVARALATVVADGEMAGNPDNRHWQSDPGN